MKNTAAVFLTSLAVSAISLTVPMPEICTVLNLFIGEDIAVHNNTKPNCETRQRTTTSEKEKEAQEKELLKASDWESMELMRSLS